MLRFALDGVKYEYDEHKLLNIEAIALQKVTGLRVTEFAEALEQGDAGALTAVVWIAKRRAGEDVKFSELEFDLMEMMESMEQDEDGGDEQTPAAEGETDPTTPLDAASSSGEPTT